MKYTPALLNILGSACQSFGIELTLVVSPYRESSFSHDKVLRTIYRRNRTEYQKTLRLRKELDDHWRDAAGRLGVRIIDCKEPSDDTSAMFYDELHFNMQGHQRFGASFARILNAESRKIE